MTTTTARARKTDLLTSHEAAGTVDVGNTRERVLTLLRLASNDGMTHESLISLHRRRTMTDGWPPATDQSIRSRCSELVRDGLAELVPGEYGRTMTGRRTRYWRAVTVQNNETTGQGVGR
ncbi:hypothetical protein [Georgenia sp. MJ170]|uniref:hypothetical protein n=1 Tax=Georgenia sunbinii TaxID=3117728 RepID=UPI002F260091